MLAWLRTIFNPSEPRKTFERALDAAAAGRRWADDGWTGANLNSDLAAGSATVRRRATHYHRNNPYGARVSAVLTGNVIGSGIRPQSEHQVPAIRDAVDHIWSTWAPAADAAGLADFYGLQVLAVRSLVEAGECFIRLRVRPPEDGLSVPLQLQILDPSQIDPALHRDLAGGGRIRCSIEFDANGRRVAYWILPDAPGEPFATALQPVRVPASDIIHVFEPLVPGQVRGLPWLVPVLLRLKDFDAYEDAALVRQKVAALFAGFLIDPDGSAGVFNGETSGSVLTSGLEPGTLKVLPPGYDVKFSDPAETGANYKAFIDQQLRAIAAGVGITFEQLTGDMTGVNYSSARVALIEFRRRAEQLQALFIHQFCRPVWQRFVDLAALAGVLPDDPEIAHAVRWVPPAWDYVDPLKDAQADQLAVDCGFKSRREVISERGRDPDAVDREIAADPLRQKEPDA